MFARKFSWVIRPIVSVLLISSLSASISASISGSKKASKQKVYKVPLATDQVKKIMDDVYTGLTGFGLNSEESELISQKGGNGTYGEILFESLQTLIKDVKLTKKDTFYDLGSGIGKACMQVALTTPAKAIGLELAQSRVSKAVNAKKSLEDKHKIKLGSRLELLEKNILDAKFKPNSVIYMCATCYSEALLNHVVKEVKNIKGGARIFSLKQLPGCEPVKTYNLPMTWSSGTNVYYYELGKQSVQPTNTQPA
jgi:SAM-dependent methyltransferase